MGVSKTESAHDARADRALKYAFAKWNRAAFWSWTRATYSGTTSGGLGVLPPNMRAIYQIRLGNTTLGPTDLRIWNRINSGASPTGKLGYSTHLMGTAGTVHFLGEPADGTAYTFHYFQRLIRPCNVVTTTADTVITELTIAADAGDWSLATIGSPVTGTGVGTGAVMNSIDSSSQITVSVANASNQTNTTVTVGGNAEFLNIPEEYEQGIISLAASYLLINKAGGARGDRVGLHQAIAADTLRDALRDNKNNPDEEMAIISGYGGPASVDDNDVRPYY